MVVSKIRITTDAIWKDMFLLLVCMVFVVGCAANEPNTLTAREKADGWVLLFDGKTTNRWHTYKAQRALNWDAIDGSLVRVRPAGALMSDETYKNFILQLDWRIPPGGNSGVYLHAAEKEADIWYVSPEVQIVDDDKHPIDTHSSAACYDLYAPTKDMRKSPGTWNHFTVICDGGHLTHYFNGQRVCDYTIGSQDWKRRIAKSKFKDYPQFATATVGEIGLQDYGVKVEFRNIKLKPLP